MLKNIGKFRVVCHVIPFYKHFKNAALKSQGAEAKCPNQKQKALLISFKVFLTALNNFGLREQFNIFTLNYLN